jgi:hypothetical protein
MNKLKSVLGLAVLSFCLATNSVKAGDAKYYQVTGPVLEVNPTYIVVQKGDDKWQIARDQSTKGPDVKVGDKVTIFYQMVAKTVAVKPAK